jgi:hypothetical protein
MKKLILFCTLLLAIPLVIFAQDVPTTPTSWGEVFANPTTWFLSFGGVSALTAFLATVVIGLLKIVKKFPKQLIAWLVGMVVLLVSTLFNFGYAKDFPWYIALLHGFAAGLAANGLFDIPLLKAILDALDGWLAKKT